MARKDLYEDRKGICQGCRKKVPKDYAHSGHIYPRGHPKRTSQLGDLILLCKDCNEEMGQRTPEEAGMIIYEPGDWSGECWEPALMDVARVAARKSMSITKYKNALLNSLRGMEVSGQGQAEDMKILAEACQRIKRRCDNKVRELMESDFLSPFTEELPRFGLLSLGKVIGILPRRPREYHNPSAFLGCFKGIIDRETNRMVKDGRSKHNRSAAGIRFQIGDSIVKTPKKAIDQRARKIYDARKEYELTKLPEKRGRQGHAHNRALGYVADMYLIAIWCVDAGKEFDSDKNWPGCPDLTWLKNLVAKHNGKVE